MLQDTALAFAGMLVTSLAGFGGVLDLIDVAIVPAKALAVLFLLLFFVMLYRVLNAAEPARSVNP
jgi:hypothetical protein